MKDTHAFHIGTHSKGLYFMLHFLIIRSYKRAQETSCVMTEIFFLSFLSEKTFAVVLCSKTTLHSKNMSDR